MLRLKKSKMRAQSKMRMKKIKNNLPKLQNNNKKLQPQRQSRNKRMQLLRLRKSKPLIQSQKMSGLGIKKLQQKRGKSKKS